MGILDDLKGRFRPLAVPKLLVDLCDYWENHPNFFCGTFTLEADLDDGALTWFMDQDVPASQVLIFGNDGIGSLFGFWIYEEKDLTKAPVVYLSGELEGTSVLARNFGEFLEILGSNRDYEPYSGGFLDEEIQNGEAAAHFKKDFLGPRNLRTNADPVAIVKNARKAVPNFPSWLEKVLGF